MDTSLQRPGTEGRVATARRAGLLRPIALHGAIFAVVFAATLLYRLQSNEARSLAPERDASPPQLTLRDSAGAKADMVTTSAGSTMDPAWRKRMEEDPTAPTAALMQEADDHVPAPLHEVYVPPPGSPPMSQAAIAAMNAHLPDGATPPQDPVPAEYLDP